MGHTGTPHIQEIGSRKWAFTLYTLDLCFMTAACNQTKDGPHGIAAVLVDDTLITDTEQFAKAEERVHSSYHIGQTQTITNGSLIKFDGMQIDRDPDGTLCISQQGYFENLLNIKADLHNNIASVRTARSRLSWVAIWTHPDTAVVMEDSAK
jgi:hypothetical protein